jgi:hypothetical protein
MYQYFKVMYSVKDKKNEWYADDEIVFGWMNECELCQELEEVKKEWFSWPFTIEESIQHLNSL